MRIIDALLAELEQEAKTTRARARARARRAPRLEAASEVDVARPAGAARRERARQRRGAGGAGTRPSPPGFAQRRSGVDERAAAGARRQPRPGPRRSSAASTTRAMTATWRLMAGDRELMAMPRVAFVRAIMLNHWYHHRGQLLVYLRLLDVPVPVGLRSDRRRAERVRHGLGDTVGGPRVEDHADGSDREPDAARDADRRALRRLLSGLPGRADRGRVHRRPAAGVPVSRRLSCATSATTRRSPTRTRCCSSTPARATGSAIRSPAAMPA